ncbi:ribonuclease 3 [Clostridium polyendosporum]|uniref:Ribonuclease 3 n=1 Tax=Clostridium polyendosporum TaxID=69208 RepID=A0A919RYL3_9CLOT|nr:ribonuclease III [Clostridium polyendosporum]GIM27835.1 ribonuclease 3 [Clostridium polyendosporum]
MYDFNLNEFEDRLGFIFDDKCLLETALTHSSYANQYKKDVPYNERLEFLGDSVLQLCISEYLFDNCKNKTEGELTKTRALIVCENSLYEVAKRLGLGKIIRMSKGEELTGGRERMSIQADCLEAVIAAIYLDKGLNVAKKFILTNFKDIINMAINDKIILDFKTRLQEVLQQNGETNISYELVKFEGPPHRRKFYTRVIIEDKVLGEGEGFSKKEAEQMSAKQALKSLEEANE